MTSSLVIIGAGGFGRETLDVVEAINAAAPTFDILGVIDDAPSALALERLAARGIAWLGGIDDWLAQTRETQSRMALYLLCIGSPTVRARIDQRLQQAGLEAAIAVHPRATIGSVGSIAAGTVVCSGAEISTNVTLGRHNHINPKATIGHDSVLADYVSINPGAIVSGEVVIGTATLVGAGAVILQGLKLGERSVIGAGACVTRAVAVRATVKGVPAR